MHGTRSRVEKARPRTLYVRRNVVNARDIISWAKSQGFKTTQQAKDLHVTIAFSRVPVDWMAVEPEDWNQNEEGELVCKPGGPRCVEALGDGGAVVLLFNNTVLCWRHEQIKRAGARWEHSEFNPHITITWDAGDLDLSKVEPYRGEIVLGPEIFEEVVENWADSITEKSKSDGMTAKVCKVDTDLGIVFGWAIICKKDGKDYYDTQGDHIPEHVMLDAAAGFMAGGRVAKEMHVGKEKGKIVFAWPVTAEIAKAMGIDAKHTGLMIGMKPDTREMLNKFKSGEYTGFSIGGRAAEQEVD